MRPSTWKLLIPEGWQILFNSEIPLLLGHLTVDGPKRLSEHLMVYPS